MRYKIRNANTPLIFTVMNDFSIVVVDGIVTTYEIAKLIRKGLSIVMATQEEIKRYWEVHLP